VSARSLATFWVLVSVYGDRAEVYDALSSHVPPIADEQFIPASRFIQILEPSGDLKRPPILLNGADGVDFSTLQSSWRALVKTLRSTGRGSAAEVADFHQRTAAFRQQGIAAIKVASPAIGRVQARKFLDSLMSLADALYRPAQSAQIERFLQHGGNAFYGDNLLALVQHMLHNRATPARGSAAQLALAEVARPIDRALEQEIAIRFERIDSLAAGEGHRPYASEHRRIDGDYRDTPGVKISKQM
jgi:hypothetical protein